MKNMTILAAMTFAAAVAAGAAGCTDASIRTDAIVKGISQSADGKVVVIRDNKPGLVYVMTPHEFFRAGQGHFAVTPSGTHVVAQTGGGEGKLAIHEMIVNTHRTARIKLPLGEKVIVMGVRCAADRAILQTRNLAGRADDPPQYYALLLEEKTCQPATVEDWDAAPAMIGPEERNISITRRKFRLRSGQMLEEHSPAWYPNTLTLVECDGSQKVLLTEGAVSQFAKRMAEE